MLDVFSWVFGFWSIWLWTIPLLIAAIVIYRLFGWQFSAPIVFLSGIVGIFLLGRKIERDNFEENTKDILRKRNEAYGKIDARRTDADDVYSRLRDGEF